MQLFNDERMFMSRIQATVAEVTALGPEIKSFKISADDAVFKAAEPGAHIDVFLPNGMFRQYSLWDWAEDGSWCAIGVKGEEKGRGGSAWLHDNLKPGDQIEVGEIRNNFALDESASGYALFAGGIGVTPMVAMARRLKELGKLMQFFYLARNEAAAGFTPILDNLALGSSLLKHFDDRDGLLDIKGHLDGLDAGTQVYFCGPEGLLNAVLSHTEAWASDRVHFERFSGDPTKLDAPTDGFELVLHQSGETLHIPENETILDVLMENGHNPDFGCMDGVCGSCTLSVIEGEVDHRDSTLTPEEHVMDGTMCICVSRAKGSRLVIDL